MISAKVSESDYIGVRSWASMFGAGPRICIGASFAMIEATIMLATFVGAAHFTLAPSFEQVSMRAGGVQTS
jgi:cytochrome P450